MGRFPLLEEPDLLRMPVIRLKGFSAPESIRKLAGDASTRVYFRTYYEEGRTAVVMVQPHPHQNQLAKFLEVQEFLENLGIPVPRIYSHDRINGVIVLEDLGDDLLEDAVVCSSEERVRELYAEAVDLLVNLRLRTIGLDRKWHEFNPPFDQNKFAEEMNYFMTHFVEGLCKLMPSAVVRATLEEFFRKICRQLGQEPRSFCHRDYHARNLIVHDNHLVMIDFQDARMGPVQYDPASLLRDSYVTLPEDLVDELLTRYQEGIEEIGHQTGSRFRYIFNVMSLQRNIKALGTFGYQISVRRSRRYQSSIARTGAYIASTIRLHEEFSAYAPVVEDYISGPALAMTPVT